MARGGVGRQGAGLGLPRKAGKVPQRPADRPLALTFISLPWDHLDFAM